MKPQDDLFRALHRWCQPTANCTLPPGVEDAVDDAVRRLRVERDAWKLLHDAKGHVPYGYASQDELQEIKNARTLLGVY